MDIGNQPIMTYSAKAVQAASAASRCNQGGCSSCVKAGLPILLVRPGVVAKPNLAHIQKDIAPMLGRLGMPRLKYLDYAARTLREGYLYAFYEKPHTPEIAKQNGWQVNLVDEGGYLTPTPLSPVPLVGTGDIPPFSCQRVAGYAAAMLFVIPDAKNTGRVWVAFSETPWAPKVLDRYAREEKLRNQRMACINAPAATCNVSLPLTGESVNRLVYDYAVSYGSLADHGNPHKRWTPRSASGFSYEPDLFGLQASKMRSENAYDLIDAAKATLSRGENQYAESKLMMVMVDDIVGISHETAVLRTTYFKSAAEYVFGRADGNADRADWMLKSALSIEGLIASLRQAGARKQKEYDDAGFSKHDKTSMMYDLFIQMQGAKMLPPEAEFLEGRSISPGGGLPPLPDYSVPGTVHLPSPVKQAEEQCKKLRNKLRGRKSTPEYASFLETYQSHVRRDSEGLLAMEDDHFQFLDCAPRKFLYGYDFDESDALSGFFYAATTARILAGGHITGNGAIQTADQAADSSAPDLGKGKGADWYARYLSDDPSLKENILLRALLGNTSQGFKEWLDKRDGHYGLMGNVLDNIEELAKNPGAAGWVKLGGKSASTLRILAAGYVSALLPITGGVACVLQLSAKLAPAALARMSTLVSVISNAGARNASATLVGVTMPLYKALRVWRRMMMDVQDAAIAAGRITNANKAAVVNFSSMLKTIGATGVADTMVEVYLWVNKVPREMEAWAQANALKAVALTGVTRQGARALQYAIRLMPGVADASWTQAVRYISGSTLAQLAGDSTKVLTNGTAVMAGGAGVLSIFSIMKSYEQFKKGNEAERAEASIGMLTGALTFAGAALTLQEQIYKAKGKDLLAANMKMLGGRLVAVASFVDAAVNIGKFTIALARGDYASTGILGLQVLVLGSAGAAAWAAAVGSSATILGIGMTGWGLILALIGIGLTFVYYYFKDSPLEEWGARSFWGNNEGGGFGGLRAEQLQLDRLQAGVKIEFELKLLTDINNPGGKGIFANATPWMLLWNVLNDKDLSKRGGAREGWVRIVMPSELQKSVKIYIGVYATERLGRGMALLGAYMSEGGSLGILKSEYPNVVDVRDTVIQVGSEKRENAVFELVKACGVPTFKYRDAHAIVWIQEIDKDGDGSIDSGFKAKLVDGGD